MTYEQALEKSLHYFIGGEIEATTFLNKYALKNGDDYLEATPDDMHQREALEFARIEDKYSNPLSYETIYDLVKDFRYAIPQGSVMAGIGNPYQIMSVSNCFVIPSPEDSYGGILKADEQLIQLMKRRAGVGIDISTLRPEGTKVLNAAGSSTGAVSFMNRFSNSTREVAQGGRRGALMITLDVRHPDIDKFITIKSNNTSVTGANISIRMRDDFMLAVERKENYILRWPIDVDPEIATITKEVYAPDIFDAIVKNAHQFAEPGVLFWDKILDESPAGCYWEESSTNPCGELPLCPKDSCRLLAINLYSFVVGAFTPNAYFDFDGFKHVVEQTQRLMDDVVDIEIEQICKILKKIEKDPEPDEVKRTESELWQDILEKAIEGRRTGLGITALGDTFAALGMRYGSDESLEIADKIFREFKLSAYRSSVQLAKERGAFPIWDFEKEKNNPFLRRILLEDPELYADMMKYGRRNISLLTIAPTGTVSLMTKTTSGIENLFKPYYTRRRKVNPTDPNIRIDFVDELGDSWQEFFVLHPKFYDWLVINKYVDPYHIPYNPLSREELDEWFRKSPYFGATSEDVDWVKKVELQGVIQKHIDHSISVTTNLPENIDVETVKEVYWKAWKSGNKGCTIYRDGSRSGVLITKKDKIMKTTPPKRPKVLPCKVFKTRYNGDNWKILVGLFEQEPYEIFAFQTGKDTENHYKNIPTEGFLLRKSSGVYDFVSYVNNGIVSDVYTIVPDVAGKSPSDEVRALTRIISTALRHGTDIRFILEQLDKSNGTIVSFSRSILRALSEYLETPELDCCADPQPVMSEGCIKCQNCGYAKCG